MPDLKRSSEKLQFWRHLLDQHGHSRMTVKNFCQQRGVSVPSFYAWRKKVRELDSSSDEVDADQRHRLIPVSVVPSHGSLLNGSDAKPIEIITPGGFILRVEQTVEPDKFAALIQAIYSCEAAVKSC